MAFDGITVAALTKELSDTLTGNRISKISQPESDEIILQVKTPEGQRRLLLSADASLPVAYLTDINKPSPAQAPAFCMLLRKHIGSGRIVSVTQPSLERIIRIEIEHLDEMGDLCTKTLITELMGKHSNIIFCKKDPDGTETIIDSIKHISSLVSSVREVLPGREYFIPNTMEKTDPLTYEATAEEFMTDILGKPLSVCKALYTGFTGFSPLMANQLAYAAGCDGDQSTASLSELDKEHLWKGFLYLITDIKNGDFTPQIIYENENGRLSPREFCAFHLSMYDDLISKDYDSISKLLEDYYAQKNLHTKIRQRSADLRRIVTTALERCSKKLDLQLQQLKDTEKMDKLRLYGELLSAYSHSVPAGAGSCELLNYYTNENIKVPLDPDLSAMENCQRYFERYRKLERTKAALTRQLEESKAQQEHLSSILTSLDIALFEDDLSQIRLELEETGYIKKRSGGKKQKITSKPLHYISSDGYDIYVGKNNIQNDYITFKMGDNGDWWFHAKKIPGSHVLVKNRGGGEMPDRVYEEAAALAAYYSKGREQTLVEIDYLQKKGVKKPGGGKPGFVIYHSNYSMSVSPDIGALGITAV